jgi:hypothetical protein
MPVWQRPGLRLAPHQAQSTNRRAYCRAMPFGCLSDQTSFAPQRGIFLPPSTLSLGAGIRTHRPVLKICRTKKRRVNPLLRWEPGTAGRPNSVKRPVDICRRCNRRPHPATASEESCPRRGHDFTAHFDPSGLRVCIAARAKVQFPRAQPLEASGSVNRHVPISYSITSSARSRIDCGTVRPRATGTLPMPSVSTKPAR